MIFNGEIYNYKELKKTLIYKGYKFNTSSDTEVLIKSFDFFDRAVRTIKNALELMSLGIL